ncbi:MAG: hydrophobe/amphiphile efflux-1 family RND transporter [Gammaproteobacteria bacterium]|nr:MAG: hydrophobe/amphiphile efflux-1 family RND transporter [Gammaproteobacteria bacterium]
MLSLFFIDRPIFALVVSTIIVLSGLLAINIIPVAQFPPITPPVVQVVANFPGANAEVLEATVTTPLEEEINSVDNLLYISSKSSNSGQVIITVTFAVGTDPDIAQVNVQNKVARAESKLPEEVTRQGVQVEKQSTNFLLLIGLSSNENKLDSLFLSNYAMLYLRNRLLRLPGIAKVMLFGAREYSMRIWLDPDRMASLGITSSDVIQSIREQNIQVAAGHIGQMPTDHNQQFQYTLHAEGRLSDVDEFENIIIRADKNTAVVKIKDIGRVELGARDYDSDANLDGSSSTMIAIYPQPGANAINAATSVREEMLRISADFPPDLNYSIDYDTTLFVEEAIEQVFYTLLIAMILVIAVIYIFLQDWRATLIPLATIPVSLIGTLAGLKLMGYSINMITLFGLILAIGIVVDDAIVVIENAQRLIGDGMSRREAAIKTMQQVTGPIIATTMVLFAVFIPAGFIPGITGELYRQFAVTVSIAVAISSLVALTLSPALCAVLLKGATKKPGLLLSSFNWVYNLIARGYMKVITLLVHHVAPVTFVFIAIVGITYWSFQHLPKSFLPDEDQGYFFTHIQLPQGAALPRTQQITQELGAAMAQIPGIEHVIEVSGLNILTNTNSSSSGFAVAILAPWSERKSKELQLSSILSQVQRYAAKTQQANIFAFNPPAIRGLGRTGGFEYQLQDTSGGDIQEFNAALGGLIMAANQAPELTRVFSAFKADVPQIYIDIDRQKAKILGVTLNEIFLTLQSQLGSYYVNDFNKFGRAYQVRIQSEWDNRNSPDDIFKLHVRSNSGKLVPLQTLLTTSPMIGPDVISHHNLLRSAKVNGSAAPGYSSGDAMQAMESLSANVLPENMTFEWSGISLQEVGAGQQAPFMLLLALVLVYLFLAAQYESWSLPLSVILTVPVTILGAIAALYVMDLNNNIYSQIGLIILIALASKNAILIVEFANQQHKSGSTIREAAIMAARLRLRAVIMTAVSFILGVFPLVVATGAAAVSRHSLGTTVFGGMISTVLIGTILVPVFFVLIKILVKDPDHMGTGKQADMI